MEYLLIITGLLCIALSIFMMYFARNPKRTLYAEDKLILSPANGRIASIQKIDKQTSVKKWNGIQSLFSGVSDKGILITIIMTPLNIHYQRAPHTGTVTDISYTKGRFGYALTTDSTFTNERNEITIQGSYGVSKTVQVAGMAARRILCFVNKKQQLQAAETIGYITYGSQTLLFLPRNVELFIKEGDQVLDAQVIGGWE